MLIIIPCIGSFVIFLIISIYIYLLFNPEVKSPNKKEHISYYNYICKGFLKYITSASGISTVILSTVISLWFSHIDQTIQESTQLPSKTTSPSNLDLNKKLEKFY